MAITRAIVIAGVIGCSGAEHAVPDALLPDAMPRVVVVQPKTLLAHDLAEGRFTGGPDDLAVLHVASPAAIDWNLHGHAGGSTQNIAQGTAQLAIDYVFAPPSQGDWFLQLRNQSDAPITVDVHLDLYGAIIWSDWL